MRSRAFCRAHRRPPWPTSDLFFSRTGMDRGRVQQTVDQALKGSDDGELFLEYSQSESFAFDDGRLKAATFDTSQGFGLRAVAGEATGYAHATEISEDAIARAADTVRAVSAGLFRRGGRRPCPHQRQALYRHRSAADGGLREEGEAAGGDERLCPRQGQPRCARFRLSLSGEWQRIEIMRAGGETLFRHPSAGAAQRLGGGGREWPPGNRQLRRRRPQRL